MKQLTIRAVGFAVLATGIGAADARYRDRVIAPAEGSAAVRQVNGNGTAALAGLHQQGNVADDLALGAAALAAVVCFGGWRPTPRVVYIDNRNQE